MYTGKWDCLPLVPIFFFFVCGRNCFFFCCFVLKQGLTFVYRNLFFLKSQTLQRSFIGCFYWWIFWLLYIKDISCKPNFTFVQLFWSGFSTTQRRNGKEETSMAWTRWVPPSAYNVALFTTWSLLCRITFLEYLLRWRFHHKLRLTSVKCVFSICWDDHVVSISCSCGVEHSWSADIFASQE